MFDNKYLRTNYDDNPFNGVFREYNPLVLPGSARQPMERSIRLFRSLGLRRRSALRVSRCLLVRR